MINVFNFATNKIVPSTNLFSFHPESIPKTCDKHVNSIDSEIFSAFGTGRFGYTHLHLLTVLFHLPNPYQVTSHRMKHHHCLCTTTLLRCSTISTTACQPNFDYHASSTLFPELPQHHACFHQRFPQLSLATAIADSSITKAGISHHELLRHAYRTYWREFTLNSFPEPQKMNQLPVLYTAARHLSLYVSMARPLISSQLALLIVPQPPSPKGVAYVTWEKSRNGEFGRSFEPCHRFTPNSTARSLQFV